MSCPAAPPRVHPLVDTSREAKHWRGRTRNPGGGRGAQRRERATLFGARFAAPDAVHEFERYLQARELGGLTFEDYDILADLREL